MQVASLHIYPVKSLSGRAVAAADVEPRGLAGDRRFMLVDDAGHFVTARDNPPLLAVQAACEGDVLRLSAPGYGDVVADTLSDFPVAVTVWRDRVDAYPVSGPVNAWLSRYLGREVTLFRMTDSVIRPVAPEHAQPGDHVSFADAYPILVANQASLDDLNARIGEPLSMARFRPNIVVSGAAPWAEDSWSRLRIGGVELAVVSPCERCVLTTIDPETQEKHPRSEPLRTMATFRKLGQKGVFFAVNAIPRTLGRVQVGDAVEVLA